MRSNLIIAICNRRRIAYNIYAVMGTVCRLYNSTINLWHNIK